MVKAEEQLGFGMLECKLTSIQSMHTWRSSSLHILLPNPVSEERPQSDTGSDLTEKYGFLSVY